MWWVRRLLNHQCETATAVGTANEESPSFLLGAVRMPATVAEHHMPIPKCLISLRRRDPSGADLGERHLRRDELADCIGHATITPDHPDGPTSAARMGPLRSG